MGVIAVLWYIYLDEIPPGKEPFASSHLFPTPEATQFHKCLAELITVKRGEWYTEIVKHIRAMITAEKHSLAISTTPTQGV